MFVIPRHRIHALVEGTYFRSNDYNNSLFSLNMVDEHGNPFSLPVSKEFFADIHIGDLINLEVVGVSRKNT